jgi:ribosomal-protein-alanine N-acetyltransferase
MSSPNKNLKYALRVCRNNDINKVMDINETTLPENYPLFFYEQILEKYPEAFTLAYLVDQPEKIIGYIMWRVERGPSSFNLDYVKKAHLVSLAVIDSARRQGVASALLNRSMNIVKDYGIAEYVLEVRVSNAGAISLYETKHAYEKMKILHQYYRDGEDAFYMVHKYDPTGRYKMGSSNMSDDEIYNYYARRNSPYMGYRCPKCNHFMIKSLNYSMVGSIDPENTKVINCSACNEQLSLYEISNGKFDIKK